MGNTYRPVTLKIVAEHAGCSIAQVSAVLNHSRGGTIVSSQKSEHIRVIAQKLGYRPNFASRALKNNNLRTIGIYMEPSFWRSLGNAYESSVYRGIEQAATKRDYDILIFNLNCNVPSPICRRKLEESRCDGIVLLNTAPQAEWLDGLVQHGHNLVAVGCGAQTNGLSRIDFDEEAAITLAISKLVELGHRRIGFLGLALEEENIPQKQQRQKFFREAVAKLQADPDPALIFDHSVCPESLLPTSDYCQESGMFGMRYFARLSARPTAVLACDSLIAVSALQEAAALGIRIPQDISLVGIDDYAFLRLFRPTLSVIDHHLPEMGAAAANLLIDLIEKKVTAPVYRVISPDWVMRSSCQKLQ